MTPKLQRAGNLEDTEDTLGGDDILNSMSDNQDSHFALFMYFKLM